MVVMNLNLDEIQEDTFDPVPAGFYLCKIETTDIKQTKRGTGQYLLIQLKIIDENFSGRVLFSQHNIENENKIAEDIGKKQIKRICTILGISQKELDDSSRLHGGLVLAEVLEDDNGRNSIKKFLGPDERHRVEKKTSFVDRGGNTISINSPNGKPSFLDKKREVIPSHHIDDDIPF